MSEHTHTPMEIEMAGVIARLTRERDNLLCRIHRDGGHYLAEHGVDKAIADAHRTIMDTYAERDTALAQCKAWREEAEAWRAWWPLNVKSDTTERRTATEPNEADIIATDAWDVLEAARARTDALEKKQGDTSCLE